RTNEEQSSPLEGVEPTQTQYHRLIPLISNLNCERNDQRQDKGTDSNPDSFPVSPNSISKIGQGCANDHNYKGYQPCKRSVLSHNNISMFLLPLGNCCFTDGVR